MRFATIYLLVAFVLLQVINAMIGAGFQLDVLIQKMLYLDPELYRALALHGYEPLLPGSTEEHAGSQYAFYPLWPLILRFISIFTPDAYLHVFGAFAALGLFALAIFFLHYFSIPNRTRVNLLLVPSSAVGLGILIFNPGSWNFFSNQTESLFLLLSVLALNLGFQKRLLPASVCAGLAALCRNQGAVLAMATGLMFLLDRSVPIRKRVARFIVSGLISGAFYAAWLAFVYVKTGKLFANLDAQNHWYQLPSCGKYLSNLFWLSPNNFWRSLVLWSVITLSIRLIVKERRPERFAVAFYLIGSVLLWPIQGHGYPNAYRFAAVLFPFWLGLETLVLNSHLLNSFKPNIYRSLMVGAAIALLFCSWRLGYLYYHSQWAY